MKTVFKTSLLLVLSVALKLSAFNIDLGMYMTKDNSNNFIGQFTPKAITWHPDNYYIISEDMVITRTGALVIEPGTDIRFRNGAKIIVDGALTAKGSAGQKIKMRNYDFEPWGGIYSQSSKLPIELAYIDFSMVSSPILLENSINLSVEHCNFTRCTSSFNGGAISASIAPDFTLSNSSSFSIKNCHFDQCSAASFGGAVYIDIRSTRGSVTVEDNVFSRNTSNQAGGALYVRTFDLEPTEDYAISVLRNKFRNNKAEMNLAGAIYLNAKSTDPTTARIGFNLIHHNFAMLKGGGIYSSIADARFFNNTIVYNKSGLEGGGVYTSGGNGHKIGFSNNIVYGNKKGEGVLSNIELNGQNLATFEHNITNGLESIFLDGVASYSKSDLFYGLYTPNNDENTPADSRKNRHCNPHFQSVPTYVAGNYSNTTYPDGDFDFKVKTSSLAFGNATSPMFGRSMELENETYSKDITGMTIAIPAGETFRGTVGCYYRYVSSGSSIPWQCTEPACNLAVSTSKTDESCPGGNGRITVSASNNISTIVYKWSTNSSASTIENLESGTYTVTVTDLGNEACNVVEEIVVQDLALPGVKFDPVLSNSKIVDTKCNGPSNAFVTYQVNGIYCNSFQYRVSGPNFDNQWISVSNQSQLTLNQLAEGSYTVEFKTGNSELVLERSFTITQDIYTPVARIEKENLKCDHLPGKVSVVSDANDDFETIWFINGQNHSYSSNSHSIIEEGIYPIRVLATIKNNNDACPVEIEEDVEIIKINGFDAYLEASPGHCDGDGRVEVKIINNSTGFQNFEYEAVLTHSNGQTVSHNAINSSFDVPQGEIENEYYLIRQKKDNGDIECIMEYNKPSHLVIGSEGESIDSRLTPALMNCDKKATISLRYVSDNFDYSLSYDGASSDKTPLEVSLDEAEDISIHVVAEDVTGEYCSIDENVMVSITDGRNQIVGSVEVAKDKYCPNNSKEWTFISGMGQSAIVEDFSWTLNDQENYSTERNLAVQEDGDHTYALTVSSVDPFWCTLEISETGITVEDLNQVTYSIEHENGICDEDGKTIVTINNPEAWSITSSLTTKTEGEEPRNGSVTSSTETEITYEMINLPAYDQYTMDLVINGDHNCQLLEKFENQEIEVEANPLTEVNIWKVHDARCGGQLATLVANVRGDYQMSQLTYDWQLSGQERSGRQVRMRDGSYYTKLTVKDRVSTCSLNIEEWVRIHEDCLRFTKGGSYYIMNTSIASLNFRALYQESNRKVYYNVYGFRSVTNSNGETEHRKGSKITGPIELPAYSNTFRTLNVRRQNPSGMLPYETYFLEFYFEDDEGNKSTLPLEELKVIRR